MSRCKNRFLAGIFFLLISTVIFGAAICFAPFVVSATVYNPGETLNPDCAPTDLNCSVIPPAASGANSDITSLSGLGFITSTNAFFTNLVFGSGAATTLTISATTTLNGGFFQSTLGNCSSEAQTLLYNATTGRFLCGVDGTTGTSTTNFTTPVTVNDGIHTSALYPDGLFIATSTADLSGLFYADASGNVSASGTLKIFGDAFFGGVNFTTAQGTSITSTNAFFTNLGLTNILATNVTTTNFNATGSITLPTNSITDAFVVNGLTIDGGTINNTPIGAAGASTGIFTSITSTNAFFNALAFGSAQGTSITSTNANFTGITFINLLGTNVTTTNFSYNNSVGTNATSTNFFTSGLAFTNANGTSITSTNASFTLLNTTSATTTNLSFGVANGTSITSTNGFFTTLAVTNFSPTNILATSITTTNFNASGSITLPTNSITDAFVVDGLTIDGGTINNTPIGLITPAAGIFTNATSTNLFTTNFLATNGTVTNFSTTNVSTTNVTTTNFNASGSIILPNNSITDAMVIDTITASNYLLLTGGTLSGPLTGTSITTTNLFATTTNFLASTIGTLNATSLTSTNAFFTTLAVTNLNPTNLTASNITSTNINTTGLTFNNALGTSITSTNAFFTNLGLTNLAASGSITLPTNSITDNFVVNGLTIDGGTINNTPIGAAGASTGIFTSITSTNAFANALAFGSAQGTSITTTNGNFTGITFTNLLGTNVTTTNVFFTTANGINTTVTNATSTNLFVNSLVFGSAQGTSLTIGATTTMQTSTVAGGFFQNGLADCSLESQSLLYNSVTGKFVCGVDGGGSASSTAGGADTQIQFNDGGAFNGSSALTFNTSTNLFSALNASLSSFTFGTASGTSITSTNASFTNLNVTNFAPANILTTNVTSTNLNTTGLTFTTAQGTSITSTNAFFTNLGLTNILATNVTTTNFNATGSITLPTNSITDAFVVNGLTIDGGTINNTPIGLITPAAGIFTNATSTNLFTTNFLATNVTTTNFNASGSIILPNNSITDAMVIDTITASNYLLLTGGTLSGPLVGTSITTTNLFATTTNFLNSTIANAVIGSVTSTNLSFTSANGTSITSTNAFFTTLAVTNLNPTNLTASNITSTNINTTGLTFNNALGTSITSTNAFFTNLGLTNLTASGSITLPTNSITDNFVVNGLTIDGGTINNTPIGATGASTGIFTSITSTNTFFTTLAFGSAQGTSITSTNGNISNLTGTTLTFTNILGTNVTSTNLSVSGLTNLGSTVLTNATSTNFNASGLSFTTANGVSITSTNASFTLLNTASATTTNLSFGIANGTSITSTNGFFTTLAVSNFSPTNVNTENITSTNANLSNLTFNVASGGSITSTNISATNLVISATTTLTTTTVSGGFFQNGLGDCSLEAQSLLYNSATGKFVCGVDASGGGGSFDGFLGSPLFVTNGSVTSTLRADGLYIATSTSNLSGLFAVNNLGSVSASGTLSVFGTTSLATTTASMVVIGGGTILPNSPLQIGGNTSSYLQVNIQNLSNGLKASSDYVATADDGTDSMFYIDTGINGSGYNDPTFDITGSHDGYLYVHGGNLAIGTASSTNVIKFFTGGTVSTTERVRITDTGLSINTTTASVYALNVNGLSNFARGVAMTSGTSTNFFSTLFGFANATGTSITSTNIAFTRLNGTSVTGTNAFFGTLVLGSAAGSSGLRLAQINSNSPPSSTAYGLLGINADGEVTVSPVTYNLVSQALVYWDGMNSPTTSGQASPLATLSGDATFVPGSGVRLTQTTNSLSGSMDWTFAQLPYERIQFNFKAGGGTGADSTWFYGYSDAVPTTEFGSGMTKGYVIYFSEWTDCAGIAYGGFSDGNQCASGGGANPLTSVGLSNIGDNNWHNVDITILGNKIIVRWDGAIIMNYTDVYTRDLTNIKFGFGSRTGGFNNNHFIRGLVVTKLGTNIAEYGIVSSTAIQSNLFWDSFNSRLGIGTSTLTSALAVVANAPNNGLVKYQNAASAGYTSFDLFDDTNVLQFSFGHANPGTGGLANINYINSNAQNPIAFMMNNTEVMRIVSTLKVGIGTSTPLTILNLAPSTTRFGGLGFGADTFLYRSAANIVRTDGNFSVGGIVSTTFLFATSSLFLNATSTNFFSTTTRFINTTITNGTSTNFFSTTTRFINTTITNGTSTNFFSTGLSFINLLGTNITSTNLNVSGLTNLAGTTITNGTSTNFFSNGLTFVNLSGGNITSTNLNVSGVTVLATTTIRGLNVSTTEVYFSDLMAPGATSDFVCFDVGGKLTHQSATCSVSSQRFKHDIDSWGDGLATIMQLNPVKYKRNSDNVEELGLIAEEVDLVDKHFVVYEVNSTTPRSVDYARLVIPLISAVKEQQEQIQGLAFATTGITTSTAGSTSEEELLYAGNRPLISALDYLMNKISESVFIVKDFVAERITAMVGVFRKVKTESIEMNDSVTGETYCMRMVNGELVSTKGNCTNASETSENASENEEIPDSSENDVTTTPSSTPEESTPTSTDNGETFESGSEGESGEVESTPEDQSGEDPGDMGVPDAGTP